MTVWQVFEATVRRFPDQPAVEVHGSETSVRWSYLQLHDEAVARARWLAAQGIAPGDRCAILADNDAAWCATYLGILRVGAVVVPLDTNYSPPQVATIAHDSTPALIFVNDRLRSTARQAVADLPGIRLANIHETPPTSAPDVLPSSESNQPAVILYTSGTTADPKGVVLSHDNLVAERDAAFQIVTVTHQDSVLGVLPLFHALAQLGNLLLPFAVGARVVFLETVNSAELVKALSRQRITIFACVPQFFYLIHQRVMQEVARGRRLKRVAFRLLLSASFRLRRLGVNAGPRLFGRVHGVMGRQMRLFITGGSKFDPAVGRDLYALGFTILQAYGLTETSGAATINDPDEAYLDTVGRVLPGQQLKILPPEDDDLDGEIAIRGPIVMQGYYKRPDATSAVMRDGWFLTGDLGRLDESGRLTITGRKKEVIILASGKNIYPDEIEAAYRRSAFVKEICVMGLTRDDDPITERLYAVVVPDMELMKERKIVNAGDLLRFELEGQSIHLPAHKRLLGYDIWFEALPRTTTGKLKRHEIEKRLRQKLRERAAPTSAGSTGAEWAADDHARAAADLIAQRARGATVAAESNLELDLGLDSMERVELITELERRFGVQLAETQAHHILTVGQLIDAVRPSGAGAVPAVGADGSAEPPWAVTLRDVATSSEPAFQALLKPRPLSAVVLFLITRLLRLIGPRVIARGVERLPRRGPYIITPNHQSYVDPFIVNGVLPFGVFRQLFFVGATEYFETPFTRWLAKKGNLMPVDPDANLVPAMKASAFGLAHGKILMLFPEGERSIDGTVKRFKKGAPILSRHLDVPVVPVAIKGAFEVWPRNRRFNWKALLPWSGHRVHVVFGPPMRFDDNLTYAEAAARLRGEVTELWASMA